MKRMDFSKKAYMAAMLCLLFNLKVSADSGEDLVAWKFETSNAVHSTPLVVDTVVYFGSTDGIFYAVNTNTGKEIWRFETPYPINSEATANDTMILFESGFKLYALDRKTGTEKWNFVSTTDKPVMSLGMTDYHHCSPVIYKNIVYYGDGWGKMNGLDEKTGTLKFQYGLTGSFDSIAIRSTPAIKDDIIYFGDYGGNAYAVSLTDSSLKWKFTAQRRKPYYGSIVSKMVIKDSLLYFGSQHDVYSPVNIYTGKAAWTFIDPNATFLPSTPAFYKDAVIVGSTIFTNKIYSLTNGIINWTFKTDGILFVCPSIVDSVLIMNTSNFGDKGTMYMVNIKNGNFINEYQLHNAAPASTVVSGNTLFVGNGDSCLYAFDLKELIYTKDYSSIFMDTVTQKMIFHKNDVKKTVELMLENKSQACDDFTISMSIPTDIGISDIVNISRHKGHICAGGKRTLYFYVYPEKLGIGNYKVEITLSTKRNPDNVLKKSFIITIDQNTGFNDNKDIQLKSKVFPNPSKGNVIFEIPDTYQQLQLMIYNLNGNLLFTKASSNNFFEWNTCDNAGNRCKSGIYIYKLISGKQVATGILTLR